MKFEVLDRTTCSTKPPWVKESIDKTANLGTFGRIATNRCLGCPELLNGEALPRVRGRLG